MNLLETMASGSPWFVYDDRAVDYQAWERETLALRELRATARTLGFEAEFVVEFGATAGLDPGGFNPPMALMSYGSNELWLEITAVTNAAAALALHGSQELTVIEPGQRSSGYMQHFKASF